MYIFNIGLHDIVFILLVSTFIAIMFPINKKWKTGNKQFVSDILTLCNKEVNNVPYSCFFIFVCRWIFLRMDIRNTNTWKLSVNGHELSIEIVFFWLSSLWLTASFFSFLIGLGVGRWKKKYCWETQSKHYSDIYKNVSHLSRLCFFLEKDFILETDVGKTKCAGI